MKKKIIISLLAIGSFALASCNTMQGVGEDISGAGRAISGAAQR